MFVCPAIGRGTAGQSVTFIVARRRGDKGLTYVPEWGELCRSLPNIHSDERIDEEHPDGSKGVRITLLS